MRLQILTLWSDPDVASLVPFGWMSNEYKGVPAPEHVRQANCSTNELECQSGRRFLRGTSMRHPIKFVDQHVKVGDAASLKVCLADLDCTELRSIVQHSKA